MDRNREARRVAMTTPNGLPRRRHRTGSLRGSPEHDGAYELQESSRFKEQTGKKDRDRENERSERDRWSRRKRRMGEKYMNGSNREDDTSEVDEEDEEETDEAPVKLMHPNPTSLPSSPSPSSTLTSHRKSYPPTWKAGDEMMGVSIPRKARSASTKRSYDCWTSAGVAGEQFLRQASSSPVASSGVVSPSAASVSPTSSSLSVKKKIANGSKQRPPKSTKSPSTIQEDIEIEVAEVLYGLMRQSQGPSKPEVMLNDSGAYGPREVNTSTDDFKSRATSRISNSSSSAPPPFSDISPKRKKPRLVSQNEENTAVLASHGSPIPTAPKLEADLQAKPEIYLPKLENNSDLPAENGGVSFGLVKSHGVQSALLPATGILSSVEKRSTAADQLQGKDLVTKEKIKEVASQEMETLDAAVNYTPIKQITTATGDKESCREKFEIDLMAPPPQSRSSPEDGGDINYHHEPMAVDGEADLDLKPSEVEKVELNTGSHLGETQKPNFKNKARGDTNLHFDLGKSVALPSGAYDSKLSQQLQNQPPLLSLKPSRNDTSTDKTAQPSFLPPLSMPVPTGWPVGVPPIVYVAPQQGAAVSVDGRTMAPTAIQPPRFLFTQLRPVRCATHGFIAKDIYRHQKLVNPIWPANAGAALLFGAPSCNLNVVPAADLHATPALRGDANPDKDKCALPATNIIVEDGDQKKQFFQSLPHGGPSNMLHGPPTLFYPLSQQEVAAASTHANSTKPMVMTAGPVSASTVTSAPNATVAAGQASPATLSFSYPNMAGNETQYMAILGNGAYQFPIPAHVGAAQAYRGAPAQIMPFFNGSYYPSPILHPSQLQLQQQAPPPPQQIHKKSSISMASSSSQKQPQNQLQRSQGSSVNGLTTNSALPTFPNPKSRASEMQQHEVGREGSPSTANGCLSRPPNMGVYGQNFTMPFNPANFALLTPPVPVPISGATVGGATNSNHTEKEQAPQAFALSFASVNGAMPAGLDNTSKAHNQVMLQTLPEAARNNYHMTAAAAAQAAQQKMNYHGSEDRKSGAPNCSNVENQRKGTAPRASASSVQSISFSRPDLVETSVATVSGNIVADTSARSSSLAPGSAHSSRSSIPNTNSNSAASNSHHQQQPFIHLQKQQQFAATATRNKAPVASNGSLYPDHFSSASATGVKFTNALSAPNVQSSNTQSQWKNPGRTTTSQVSSPSVAASITASMKNLGQQQGRPQQGQTHISFGGNQKASTASQVQQGSPSPSMMVGSPSASSVSKGQGGSPRMPTSASVGGKPAQSSSMTTQQGKNSPSVHSQKSSPVAGPGRNLPSAFGNPHMPVSSSMGSSKPQSQQQPQQLLQQPQLSKQSIQQAQMFFNTAYLQTYSTAPGGAAPAAGGFQLQRHQPKQQQQPSKSQGAPTITVSSGMSLNSTLANASTNDPVKAVAAAAAAASNIKGGTQSQSVLHAVQTSGGAPMVVSSGFTYVHAVPAAAVLVNPAEQKQPAA